MCGVRDPFDRVRVGSVCEAVPRAEPRHAAVFRLGLPYWWYVERVRVRVLRAWHQVLACCVLHAALGMRGTARSASRSAPRHRERFSHKVS